MSISFLWYTDAGLTSPLVGNLVISQASDGSTGPVDNVLYLGSTDGTKKIQADSDPGVDNIQITIEDTDPGSGHEVTEVKLSTTFAGLGSAVAGDPLVLGTELLGGVGNAQPVYIRVEDATMTVGTSTELSVETVVVREVDV